MLDDTEFEIEHVENQTIMLDQSDLAALHGLMAPSKGPQFGQSASAMARDSSLKGAMGPSLIERYRHKGLNTLYYLRPASPNVYLLDFKNQSFSKERLKSQTILPTAFSSV